MLGCLPFVDSFNSEISLIVTDRMEVKRSQSVQVGPVKRRRNKSFLKYPMMSQDHSISVIIQCFNLWDHSLYTASWIESKHQGLKPQPFSINDKSRARDSGWQISWKVFPFKLRMWIGDWYFRWHYVWAFWVSFTWGQTVALYCSYIGRRRLCFYLLFLKLLGFAVNCFKFPIVTSVWCTSSPYLPHSSPSSRRPVVERLRSRRRSWEGEEVKLDLKVFLCSLLVTHYLNLGF